MDIQIYEYIWIYIYIKTEIRDRKARNRKQRDELIESFFFQNKTKNKMYMSIIDTCV